MKEEDFEIIARGFKKVLGNNLIAVTLHGSYASKNPHKNSDIDYFFVLKKISLPVLVKIKRLKKYFEERYSKELSINIQKASEMPSIRNEVFYHKNRYALFLHETNKIDRVIIGKNPYLTKNLPSDPEIKVEAIRIINSFAYFLRKFIVNSSEEFATREAIRYVTISTQYANAFVGIYPLNTSESVNMFRRNFPKFKQRNFPIRMLRIKRSEEKLNGQGKLLAQSISFLESLDEYLFEKYINL